VPTQLLPKSTIAAVVLFASAASAYTNPLCWAEPRMYAVDGDEATEILAAFDAGFTMDRAALSLPAPFELNADHAYAFALQQSAVEGRWSGATHSELLVFTEEPTLLRLTFSPVQGVGPVRWISKRLLFARVWVGRHNVVDIIVDVETAAIVHRSALRDGQQLRQQALSSCSTLATDPECKPTCRNASDPPPNPSLQRTPPG
jgi:hypothetical protein